MISKDRPLIVRYYDPFQPSCERIVIPRLVMESLVTALHIKFDHPSCHQKQLMHRHFFALDMDKSINHVTTGCHHCASLRKIIPRAIPQSSDDPPNAIGVTFAADILKREQQLILVLRECITSYTRSSLIHDERHDTLRDGLQGLIIELHPMEGPRAVIRTDQASAFKSLTNYKLLQDHRISLELERAKNPNKNPVTENAIQE